MTQPLETCREWVERKADRCNELATVIIWGKLFASEALGPRCDGHAYKHIGHDYYTDRLSMWAVFDLRDLERRTERVS